MKRTLPFVLAPLLAACSLDASNPAPPRVVQPTPIPSSSSSIAVSAVAKLAALEQLVDAELPQTLLEVDRRKTDCVPAQRVTACLVPKIVCKKGLKCSKTACEVGLRNTRITPGVSCRIIGHATRGPVRLSGEGQVLRLAMPVSAEFSVKDIGNVIKSPTATADAEIRATILLDIHGDWQPVAKVDIDYAWTREPGISLLGERITFTGKADPELAKVIARLEADIPRHIDRLQPRAALATAWEKGFTVVMLNRKKPPAWLRISPEQLRFIGYRVHNDSLILDLAATARTETFLSANKPRSRPPTPLPPPAPLATAKGFRFDIPVVADYAQLEPVLDRALGKLSERTIRLPGNINVRPVFGRVTIYTTTGGRIAIGVPMTVMTPRHVFDARGTVWLTGQPWNHPGSQKLFVNDLTVAGKPATPAFALLLAVAQSETVQAELRAGLSQDFARDYAKVLLAAHRALRNKRLGAFVFDARIDSVVNGTVQPVGQGLYMPVWATGTSVIEYAPSEPLHRQRRGDAAHASA